MSFTISIKGNKEIDFYTIDGLLVARGYQRIVIGDRGPYIEFNKSQIIMENLYIPEKEQYRIENEKVYYIEYRTKINYVKIYYQKKSVKYANYKIGFFYVSPYDLFTSWRKGKGRIIREKTQSNLNQFIEG